MFVNIFFYFLQNNNNNYGLRCSTKFFTQYFLVYLIGIFLIPESFFFVRNSE